MTVIGRFEDPAREYPFRVHVGQFEYFDPIHQPDLAPILRRLHFETGSQIEAEGGLIGIYLQNPRRLTRGDCGLLAEYANNSLTKIADNSHEYTG